MFEVNDRFREDVVASAESYLGTPPSKLNIVKFDASTIELGTMIDSGFNCSGLVLRSINDAIGKGSLAQRVSPEYRRSIDIVNNLSAEAALSPLIYSEVEPGDIIARLDDDYPPGSGPHLMIASGRLGNGRVPFIHATRVVMHGSGEVVASGVMRGNLRSRPREDFFRIPLGLLATKAFQVNQ